MRVVSLAIAPDCSRVVVVGIDFVPPEISLAEQQPVPNVNAREAEYRLSIYSYASRTLEMCVFLSSSPPPLPLNWLILIARSSVQSQHELTSVKISKDARYALVNEEHGVS